MGAKGSPYWAAVASGMAQRARLRCALALRAAWIPVEIAGAMGAMMAGMLIPCLPWALFFVGSLTAWSDRLAILHGSAESSAVAMGAMGLAGLAYGAWAAAKAWSPALYVIPAGGLPPLRAAASWIAATSAKGLSDYVAWTALPQNLGAPTPALDVAQAKASLRAGARWARAAGAMEAKGAAREMWRFGSLTGRSVSGLLWLLASPMGLAALLGALAEGLFLRAKAWLSAAKAPGSRAWLDDLAGEGSAAYARAEAAAVGEASRAAPKGEGPPRV